MSLLLMAPLVSGCGSASDMFSTGLLSKDAEWFSRSGRVFIKNVSIEAPPLTPDKPVTPDDLISADGLCPGMAPPIGTGESSALSDSSADAPTTPAFAASGTVALGHTECDVTRGIGAAPDNVHLSNNPGGDRVAVLTFLKGPRAGIYTFTAGRLSSIERAPEPAASPKLERRAKRR
ncbi:hypothetical protein NB311A_19100 [Nitrobacter sp. Nb-311A]|uniref:hypothetical protein n=1 Tax=unclassified Nitrobacter TaxID=2620411 RepID=UPI0000684A5A|nr:MULTISPECIES: hypothetical protein [unclassified Nitrobacter]EAQ34727.1 hypothetical protein NB311A_19100 [Nitrobacter sp. Nb-311A]MCB1392700.1 hypothetical protein [Nitrobacter sp.]MCV0385360.1 hypothetical protein [Nitrobacter sp.]